MGVCCSGGGIRSAAYNLGALQALQETEELQRAKYLAAVSGGSYIASAYAMVRHDLPREAKAAFSRGSPEEQYLRNRTSYLAHGTREKVQVLYRILLGVLLNLVAIGVVLVPCGFFLGLAYRAMLPELRTPPAPDLSAVVSTTLVVGIVLLATAAALLGVTAILLLRTSEQRRERLLKWSIQGLALTGAAAALTIGVPVLLVRLVAEAGSAEATGAAATTLPIASASLLTVVSAVLLQLRARTVEPDDLITAANRLQKWWRGITGLARRVLLLVAATIAGPLLLTFVLLTLIYAVVTAPALTLAASGAVAVCTALAALIYLFTDLTSWSLHPFYRRQLSRAFALRRCVGEDSTPDLAKERDYDEPFHMSKLDESGMTPKLVVCAAANVSDPAVTAPGRAVTSFTFEADSIGGPLVGYVRTKTFEEAVSNRASDFTLPAAVAMSGAALSPSMGKLTRRHLTFLLALANVRLGVWVPNPREMHQWPNARGRLRAPRPRPSLLARELLGKNRINARFLYVTDGGHYENLGLVELLRRGCTDIYCFDASGGSPRAMATLGDAIALARSELGVTITFPPGELEKLVPDGEPLTAERDCARGDIRYADGTRGVLIYARTVVTQAAPWDVRSFHVVDPRFPHHATTDQLYSEQRFEAYRALGELAGRNAQQRMHEAPPVRESAQLDRATTPSAASINLTPEAAEALAHDVAATAYAARFLGAFLLHYANLVHGAKRRRRRTTRALPTAALPRDGVGRQQL